MASPLVELVNIVVSFSAAPLLNNINLTLSSPTSLGIIGPGGVGKSLLLKVMAGLIHPDYGESRFNGVSWSQMKASQKKENRKLIQMTFQQGGLFDSMTVIKNLEFALRETGTREKLKERTEETLSRVGLLEFANLNTYELSGGMQKRLSLARALVMSPQVLLCDDPVAGLDPLTSRSIIGLIDEIRRSREITVVVVTSDPTVAFRCADKMAFLYNGKLHELSSTEAFLNSENPMIQQFLHGRLEGPLTVARD